MKGGENMNGRLRKSNKKNGDIGFWIQIQITDD